MALLSSARCDELFSIQSSLKSALVELATFNSSDTSE